MNVSSLADMQRQTLRSRSAAHIQAISGLLQHTRKADAGEILVNEGTLPSRVMMIESGWAIRYKTLADGRRQIDWDARPGTDGVSDDQDASFPGSFFNSDSSSSKSCLEEAASSKACTTFCFSFSTSSCACSAKSRLWSTSLFKV